MFETNSIIRASAGTGKTFALATRFIRLMLLDGVAPETIVALTFSRAAAQEIYTKILERLCRAATEGVDSKGRSFAESEWKLLLDDFQPDETGRERIRDGGAKLAAILANPPPHAAADFARLLRRLVDTQHLGAIATLDSFILKIVRNFPKEMGIVNAVSVLDPIDEEAAVDDAVRSALSRTDCGSQGLAEAFVASQMGDFPRTCLASIGEILGRQGWRNFVLSHPDCIREGSRWTARGMAAKLGVNPDSVCPDFSVLPYGEIKRKNCISHEESFVNWVRSYDGTASPVKAKESVVALMRHYWENPAATTYEYSFYGKTYGVGGGAPAAKAIRDGIRHMMDLYLWRQLQIVEAKLRLVEAVEAEYGRLTRKAGKLTFADFTAYSAEEEFSKRGIALKNVEFRFDSKFGHWALDEFQDTSELQWRCLKELVRNAAEEGHEGGERTAMAVGDMKQSIYTWRGASARPFEDLASWGAFAGFERDFSLSHRYGPNIASFVNRVFGLENIRLGGPIPSACADAVESWRAGWRDHVSDEAPDYVKVVGAGVKAEGEEDDAMMVALADEVRSLWTRHREEKSSDTVGILVRGNRDGLLVADFLRMKGLDVVWEGLSPCGDDPVVQSVLALLKLADHPGDSAAWQTVSALIDIRSVLLPSCATVSEASAAVSRLLTQQGLARTLKDWCGALRACGKIDPSSLTVEKLRQLVECAVAFEARPAGDGGMLAFAEFVAGSGRREIAASSDVIRILTIHRSKGLGIDHVFVPFFERSRAKSAIDLPNGRSPLESDDGWVVSHLAKGSERFNSKTAAACARMRNARFAEALRTYYVALTRAKKSMVVILSDSLGAAEEGKGLLMSDLVRSAVGTLPYVAGEIPSLKSGDAKPGIAARARWAAPDGRIRVERVTPSHGAGHSGPGRAVAEFFDADYGEAAQRGIAVHASYAAVEWIAPGGEHPFREAFVKPSDDATVWRERSYELYLPQDSAADGGEGSAIWESGQFDRVVFAGAGDGRSAVIYDFKTNARRPDESEAAFAERMRGLYSRQMASYRRALHLLTGIPSERIEARLLLESTGQSVRCPNLSDAHGE